MFKIEIPKEQLLEMEAQSMLNSLETSKQVSEYEMAIMNSPNPLKAVKEHLTKREDGYGESQLLHISDAIENMALALKAHDAYRKR